MKKTNVPRTHMSHMSASESRMRGQTVGVSGEKPGPRRGLGESCRQGAGNMLDLLLNILGVLDYVPASTVTI